MNTGYNEGEMTKSIEGQTAKMTSSCYLVTAILAMGTSMCMKCMKKNHSALFIGEWVAPILLFGIYNKIVKQKRGCDC